MERSNWTAMMTLENLTQEQIDELIVKLIEIVEGMGGFVGGGFMPAKELAQIERAAYQEARAALLPFARTSHRAQDLGPIEDKEDRHD